MAYKGEIHYDPALNNDAGYVEVVKEGLAARPPSEPQPLRQRDSETLLYVLFQLLYTRPGRDLMRQNKPIGGVLAPEKRRALDGALQELGITDLKVRNAIIDAHVAAENWVEGFKEGGQAGADKQEYNEKIYLQQMAFITWSLWEDAKGHEFSMGW